MAGRNLDKSLDDMIAEGASGGRKSPLQDGEVGQRDYRGSFRGARRSDLRNTIKIIDKKRSTFGDWHRDKSYRRRFDQRDFFSAPALPNRLDAGDWSDLPKGHRNAIPAYQRTVRVKGLAFSVLQKDLTSLFSSIGPIEDAWIEFDHTDRSLGSGWAIFEHPRDAITTVRELNGRAVDGSPIHLEILPEERFVQLYKKKTFQKAPVSGMDVDEEPRRSLTRPPRAQGGSALDSMFSSPNNRSSSSRVVAFSSSSPKGFLSRTAPSHINSKVIPQKRNQRRFEKEEYSFQRNSPWKRR